MPQIQIGITLFSLAHPYLHLRLDLEGCLALVKELGYQGIELVSAQMAEGYPTPNEQWCSHFVSLMNQYGLEGFAYGSYVDMTRFHGRNLTEEEIFQSALGDIQAAQRLGFACLKTQCSMPIPVVERLIPIAREMGIWLGFELHAPNHCRDAVWKPLFDLFDVWGPDILGVVPDTGIFAEGTPASLEDLEYMLPYCRYIHGKYFYINESLKEERVPFPEIVALAEKCGYQGAIAAEYEGYFQDAREDSVEQVRRYACMMQKLLRKEK